ncbi:MAG: SDR family oxidoreductase [Gammaproteobacteria bacterium]
MNELFSLTGKIALVTGSSRGLGWAMAQALAQAGAHVLLNGRDQALLAERREALARMSLGASVSAFDVTDEAAGAQAIQAIVAEYGRLDVLVANAGIQHRRPLTEFATADFQRVLDTNLTACFVLAREAAKPMLAQKSGRIIFTASVMCQVARPTVAAYIASKGGVMALTKALAVELGPHGITVNALAPGYFATEMNIALVNDAKFNAWVESRTPLGRWAQPEELGGAAVFLASRAGSYVNGHVLNVDGGLVINA